jgi:hypothetical protein
MMSDPFFQGGSRKPAINRDNLRFFLRTPEGLEYLADAVHLARRLLSGRVQHWQIQVLSAFENKLRAASARPLPAELAM